MTTQVAFRFEDILHDQWSKAPSWIAYPLFTETDGWLGALPLCATLSDQQPIDQNSDNQVAILLPAFSDDFYNHIHIDPAFLNVGNVVSDQVRTIRIFNAYFVTKTLEEIVISGGTGLILEGITPPSVIGILETVELELTVSTNGPAQIDASLFFDFPGTVDDVTVHVVGIRIVSLAYQAEKPAREALEWKTEVLTANSGTEQRVRLRRAPRQFIRMDYPIELTEMGRVKNQIHGWLQNRWAVPMWPQAQVLGPLASGLLVIPCDGEHYDFREGELILLWDSNQVSELVEIDTVETEELVLTRVTGNSYSNAWLMPAGYGRMFGEVPRKTTGYNATLSVNYQILNNLAREVSAPEQYLGEDIYYDEIYMDAGGLTDGAVTRVDVVDFETGLIDYYSPWENIRTNRPYRIIGQGAEEAWAFRQFLHRRAGRLHPFWLPSFEPDMRLSMSGPISTTLTVHDDDYRGLGFGRDHIAVKSTDGTWYPREVTGTALAGAGLINVSVSPALSLDASEVELICFLGLKRFDTDRVEIDWLGGGVFSSTVRILEVEP